MKYFIYARKSEEEENKQVQSIETQLRILNEFVKHNNLSIVGTFIESKSAKEDGLRPQFDLMIEGFNRGEAEGLLVAHIDRITRNGIEAGLITKLHTNGFIKEIRTPVKVYNTIQDILLLDIEFAMAAHYSRNLSVRVKEGIETKIKRGEYPSFAPIGYVNNKGKIYPDKDYAPYITEAYKLYATNEYSLEALTNYLYDKGFRTRLKHQKVTKSVVHRLLKDPVYYGAIRRNGNVYPGIHEPLIDKATFDTVQTLITKKSTGKKISHTFMYRGYLYCGNCGCKLTAAVKKGKHIYYYCTNGKKQCGEHKRYLTNSDVKVTLQDVFNPFTLDHDLAEASFQLYVDDLRNSTSQESVMKQSIERQIEKIDQKLSNLLDLLLEESIDRQKYDEKSKELENAKAQLQIQLKQVKPVDVDFTLEQVEKIKNEAYDLAEMFREGDDEVREDLLKSVLWNAEIKNKKVISIRYKAPWIYLKDLHKTRDLETWRAAWDGFSTLNWNLYVDNPREINNQIQTFL